VTALKTRIDPGFRARPHQNRLHHSLKRFNVIVAHRRFGKTVWCINEMLERALRCNKPRPRYAYIAPLHKQAKQVAWDYAKHYTRPIPGMTANEAELRVDFIGERRISLYGADNPDALRGIYLDGVVLDEPAQMRPRVWSEIIRPTLADRGGWAIFIGTPKGHNEFFDLYEGATAGFKHEAVDGTVTRVIDPDWYGTMFKARETGILPAAEIAGMRRVMSEDEAEQELECSFSAAIVGAYYAKLLHAAESETPSRIGRVPYEPKLPVQTAWDLGVGDDTAIWFVQQNAKEVWIIDYYENRGVGLDHYAKILRERPYSYSRHILPHDVDVRELGSGKTRLETLRSLGIGRIDVLPRITTEGRNEVEDGIQAVRALLPRCWFDASKCMLGLEAMRHYRREYDEERKVFAERPLHDWTSHAADAFRYLARGLQKDPGKMKPISYDNRGIV